MTSVGVVRRRPASIAASTASGAPPRRDAHRPWSASSATIRGAAEVTVSVPASTITTTSARPPPTRTRARAAGRWCRRRVSQPAPSRLAESRNERASRLELPGAHATPDRADRHADELLAEAVRGEIALVAVLGWRRAEQGERRAAGEDADEPDEVHGLAVP